MTNSEIKRHAVGNAPGKQSFRAFQDPRSCLAYSTCHMEPDHNVMNEIALLTKPVVMFKADFPLSDIWKHIKKNDHWFRSTYSNTINYIFSELLEDSKARKLCTPNKHTITSAGSIETMPMRVLVATSCCGDACLRLSAQNLMQTKVHAVFKLRHVVP